MNTCDISVISGIVGIMFFAGLINGIFIGKNLYEKDRPTQFDEALKDYKNEFSKIFEKIKGD